MKTLLSIISLLLMLASCVSGNSTQVFAAMSGLNAGATLGGAIGGLTSRTPRGYHMGTTIGALSGAAIGAIATAPREKKSNDSSSSAVDTPRKEKKVTSFSALSGIRRDVRVTNVLFRDSSGDRVLQPGETAVVSYDIINVTPYEINILIPKMQLSSQAKRIHISPMQNITNIPSGEGVRYSLTITADSRLKRGDTELTLFLSCDNGATFTAMNTIQISTRK